jgi:16S rRNA (guanine966-N2)-methyltransferase
MRVVAGSAKGRKLKAPKGDSVRPTSDMVRQAVFNSLASLGGVEGEHVVDLFAGTGALGIEALSRGAASATFVELDSVALRVIAENLETTRLQGEVVRSDAVAFLRDRPRRWGVVFADPPYEFDGWEELLAHLDCELAVLESDRAVDPGPGWEVLRGKRYGGTVVTLIRPISPKGDR